MVERATALIVAAGSGQRLGGGVPKQYRMIGGKPVLRWAVEALARHPQIDAVRVVIGQGQQALAEATLSGLEVGSLIIGGEQRADSVRAGLAAIDGETVLVHDAARPFCPTAVIDRLLAGVGDDMGAVPTLPVSDTLARADGLLGDPIDRTGAVRVQTPQAFRLAALRSAYDRWTGPSPTDEATVARAAGIRVAEVAGDPALDKLTSETDWQRAEAWLAARLTPRTGLGFDVHAFAGDGPVMLGGIAIAHNRGLAGHSDADVVLHALTDALLGAAGLGDIGEHFPPSDPR
ncbi:MAG: 2-C-methyl-D-erythritol 4-phosphate cytidylyltransferase, partial [Sphingomicrobium sp.]